MSKVASKSVTKVFEDSSSDDDEQSSPVITKRKAWKRKQPTVEPDVQEEAPTTSGQNKEKKNKSQRNLKLGTHNAYMRLHYVMVYWQGGAESVTMTKNNIQTKCI